MSRAPSAVGPPARRQRTLLGFLKMSSLTHHSLEQIEVAVGTLARVLTGEKNEKKRAGRMSRTQAEMILSGSESILGGSKLGLGCVLPPKNAGCPQEKNTFKRARRWGARGHSPNGPQDRAETPRFFSFTGKRGGARPPPNKQETRKPRNKLPQESRKTCKNMVFLYTEFSASLAAKMYLL